MGFTHLLVLSMNSLKTSSKAGFTLIEIVAVVTIITVVIAVTAPQVGGVFTAVRLRTDADAVYSKLLEAQSLAVLFITDAELRLYEVPDLVGERATLRKLRILTLRPPEDDAAVQDGWITTGFGGRRRSDTGPRATHFSPVAGRTSRRKDGPWLGLVGARQRMQKTFPNQYVAQTV